jgi:hypothetical protein
LALFAKLAVKESQSFAWTHRKLRKFPEILLCANVQRDTSGL